MIRRIEDKRDGIDLDAVTRDQADNSILIADAGNGQVAFYVGNNVAFGTWVDATDYCVEHAPTQAQYDAVSKAIDEAAAMLVEDAAVKREN